MVPSEQGQNRTDFQYLLSQVFPDFVQPPATIRNFGNRRLSKAYAYLRECFVDRSLEETLTFLEKLKQAVIVKIEVSTYADAFLLFSTINNRGEALSAIDIIKNNLLAELDKRPDYGLDRAFEEWKDMIARLPEATVQERFLRQLYNAFKYLRWVQVRGCPRATRSNLITIYDTLLRRVPVRLFRTLQEQAACYAALIDPDAAKERWNPDVALALTDLQRLGAAPAYAFLLWTSQVARDHGWDEGSIVSTVARFLTKWFFWRNLTDTPPTRELDLLFVELIETLLQRIRDGSLVDGTGFACVAADLLRVRAADQALCDTKLDGDLYEENYDVTRFLLCKLEEAHQTLESRRDLWAYADNGKPVFTVEHVLPKTENLNQNWVAMVAAGDVVTASEIRERCAHRLGNLTLSGYNSALGKMDFIRKRDRRNNSGEYIGYRNGLYLNRKLSLSDTWSEKDITARTSELKAEIKGLFALAVG